MNNETIVIIKQVTTIGLLAMGMLAILLYTYWNQVKDIKQIFKGTIVAFLVTLGLYEDKDNNT